jgi:outer membrane protein
MGIQCQSGWVFRCAVAAAAALTVTAAAAADYPTKKAPPPAPAPVVVAPVTPGFFVKAGFLYAINQTSSKQYAQNPFLGGTGPEIPIPGVNATVGNVATLGVEVGYFVTPNVSVDISAGVPMWADVKSKGTPGCPFDLACPGSGLPLPPNGTLLAKIMPSFVPLTVLYHFNQFGAFQPYLGGGLAATFSFETKDEFQTGVKVDPTVGLVLQGGADVMIDQHWGWSFDVKKVFANVTSHGTGDNVAALGQPYPTVVGSNWAPNNGTLKTNFQPWVLSTGITYRF